MTKNQTPKKDFAPAIALLEGLTAVRAGKIKVVNGEDSSQVVTVVKNRKGYEVVLVMNGHLDLDRMDPISFVLELDGHTVQTASGHLRSRSFEATPHKLEETYRFSLTDFESHGQNAQKAYWRIVLPLDEPAFRSRLDQLQCTSYETGSYGTASRIPVQVAGVFTDVIFHIEGGRQYVIYDVLGHVALEMAVGIVHDVALALGYITGEFVQNECYCFAYSSSSLAGTPEHFLYHVLRDSIKTSYAPICSNPYCYLYDKNDDAERLYPLLRNLSISEFSNLCQRVHEDDQFAALLLLIQESMAASVVAMPPGLCVALEAVVKTAATAVSVANVDTAVMDFLSKELPGFRQRLMEVKSTSNEGLVSAISNRINELAKPSNRSRLEAPFKAVGYILTSKDLQAINSRNRFLHGDVLLGNKRGVEHATKEAYYMALRLYALLAVLILRPTGYDNYIVNYAKLREDYLEVDPVDEDYYISFSNT